MAASFSSVHQKKQIALFIYDYDRVILDLCNNTTSPLTYGFGVFRCKHFTGLYHWMDIGLYPERMPRGRPPGLISGDRISTVCISADPNASILKENDMELFTASCSDNKLLLRKDEHKDIVVNSLAFLAKEERIWLYGYVIMEDEFHVLWKKQPEWEHKNIRQMLLKYTAQQIKRRLWAEDRKALEPYRSQLHDRQYQFWDKAAFSAVIPDADAAEEKIRQLHEVPLSAGLCTDVTDYTFSSAAFYREGYDPEGIMTHYQHCFTELSEKG